MTFLNGWSEFVVAFGVFFLTHSIPVRPPVKAALSQRIGQKGFTLSYSLLSIAVLTWLVAAAGRAPYVELWAWAPWQSWVTVITMLPATLLVSMALARPNPLSFGGNNNHLFDREHPGIVGWVRHPLLGALFLWSASHIVPNGSLAHVLLFGTFALFSILGMNLIDKRNRCLLSAEDWQGFETLKKRVTFTLNGVIRVVIGTLIYIAILVAHPVVIGVSPLP